MAVLSAVGFYLLLLLCLVFRPIVARAVPSHIAYTVTVADIPRHRLHVTVMATGLPSIQSSQDFALPAWSPGWYVLTHAYRNIVDFAAFDSAATPLPVSHPDPLTWRVSTTSHTAIRVEYDVIARDQDPDALDIGLASRRNYGFFAPYLDSTHAFVPGPAVLLYAVDGKQAPCSVSYHVPDGWKIASANDPAGDLATLTAPDYDTLADQPADLGKFRRFDREVGGVPVSIVIVGADGIDPTKWVNAVFRIAAAGIALWGRNTAPPFPRYIFHFRFPENEAGGGGLEHLNGAVITLDSTVLRDARPTEMELVAHEFFHAWNVKRARPAGLGPFDYTQAVRVKDLWWSEGVTDYFAPQIVVDAGLADPAFRRNYMTDQINELERNPARRVVTLETASLNAWEGKSSGFGGLSYYNKGAVVGLLLDIEMRHHTANRIGLIDILRTLLAEAKAQGHGFADGEIERVADRLTGTNLSAFFDPVLRTTVDLPYADILPAAGLRLEETGTTASELGWTIAVDPAAPNSAIISALGPGSPAERGGVRVGDRVLQVAGIRGNEFEGAMDHVVTGIPVQVKVVRDTLPLTLNLLVGAPGEHGFRLVQVPHPTPEQSAILAAVLGRTTLPAAPPGAPH